MAAPTTTMTKANLVEGVLTLGDLTRRRDSEVIVETVFDAVIGGAEEGRKD